MKNTVALIGKPNVGKSTLFNKIIGKKKSITDSMPGVTRDRIYAKTTWLGKTFNIIDTGGIEIENRTFQDLIQMQSKVAIEEAQVIVLVLDGQNAIDSDDYYVVDLLRKSNKKVLVVANKLEGRKSFDTSIYSLGFEHIFPISAIHGEGVGDLLDEIIANMSFSDKSDDNLFKLAIIGKPNAGKSTLLNKLVKSERSITSNIPGTTRDSVSSKWVVNNHELEIVDTAGIIRKSKVVESVDFYALLRAFNSLDEADLSLVIVDASQPLSHFDSRLSGYAFEKNKPIILVINKWDLIEKETNTQHEFVKKIKNNYKFIDWAPIVFLSAKTGEKIHKLAETIIKVKENLKKRISTNVLNRFILEIQIMQPPRSHKGKRLHISFAQQVEGAIPTFVFNVNDKDTIHFSYQRYIENQLRKYFGFEGCPIKIVYKNIHKYKK
ncbi:GTP-binding protein EngA [Mesomycoplasma conjunctivae]|uniref:GTPase Der n=1 Tax=Mesomycoplasma conjunctivae (strain ATCC 25834 / NCTC 10147 / HRC/581) TaxID=572263 RepID=C5J631_MESCH|nr:ribosome biogenesis GTPase Der [Mesomycoplasma conjunctivae]CAT04923.1 GTP-binding protein EngA [Mesomycoplasma conjunctivae]VEU66055.1 GTP-binding protein EngA [Mesomycoplasma conjunctivae]